MRSYFPGSRSEPISTTQGSRGSPSHEKGDPVPSTPHVSHDTCPYCKRSQCPLCENFLAYLRFRLGDLAENELALWWRKNGADPITVSDMEHIFQVPREELTAREATRVWLPGIHHHLCCVCTNPP